VFKVQLIEALKVHPEKSRHTKILAEAQGCIRRYIALSGKELIDPVGRNCDNLGEIVSR